MGKEVFCSTFGISADESKIYGIAYYFNEIYEIDLLSHEMKSLGQLEGEKNTFGLIQHIECCLNKVIFIPANRGEYFHVLDIETNKQTKYIKREFFCEYVENQISLFHSFVWNNKVYVIGREKLSVFCYDPNKDTFEMVFKDNREASFKCWNVDVCGDYAAFLSTDLNEIGMYNLCENHMEWIELCEEMRGVIRIAISEERIALYKNENQTVYFLDRNGNPTGKSVILSEIKFTRVYMRKGNTYLSGQGNGKKENFEIDNNGNVEEKYLKNMIDADIFYLNKVGDNLYAYELVDNTAGLVFNADKCLKYRLGNDAVEIVEWKTDDICDEDTLINRLKNGNTLIENKRYGLRFMIKHMNCNSNNACKEDLSIGENIYNQLV